MPSSSRNSVKNYESDYEVENENKFIALARFSKGRKIKLFIPRLRIKNVDRTNVFCKEVTVNSVSVMITEFKMKKRKLSEVNENQCKLPSKKISSKISSPDKNIPKETATLSRSKTVAGETKRSSAKGNKSAAKHEARDESLGKKRSSNQSDLSDYITHSASSKKMASSVDGI